MQGLIDWLLSRLQEASTWRGIIGVLTSAGVVISPDKASAIIATGLALMGLVNILRNEKNQITKVVTNQLNQPQQTPTTNESPVANPTPTATP